MSKVVLYMSMSVDGFIAGPDDGPGRGLGVGGERLHDWLGAGGADPGSYRPADEGQNAVVFDELMATGAVITGRRTFDHAGGWAGDHHDGVPIFVLTRATPAEPAPGSARYVTDGGERGGGGGGGRVNGRAGRPQRVPISSHQVPDDPRRAGPLRHRRRECAARARAAAGHADVMVHGAGAAQALLLIGELDELELHVVPVLLGQGRRLFDHLPAEHIELDLLRRLTPDDGDLAHRVMHLRYRVRP